MKMFCLGFYCAGVVLTFFYVGFFCLLGGRSEDMWKPFVYALLWPAMLPLFVSGRVG